MKGSPLSLEEMILMTIYSWIYYLWNHRLLNEIKDDDIYMKTKNYKKTKIVIKNNTSQFARSW